MLSRRDLAPPSTPFTLLPLALLPLALLALAVPLLAAACGSSSSQQPVATSVMGSGEPLACPPPIGAAPREDCAEVAEEFGALTLQGAQKLAGSGRDADARRLAIKEASALAAGLKEQRVALCEAYDKCKVFPAEHHATASRLGSGMGSLIDLWNKRNFARMDAILRFREGVRAIDARVNCSAAKAGPPRTLTAEDALAVVEGPGLAVKRDGSALTVTAKGAGEHLVMQSRKEAMPFLGGRHYRVKITGRYVPTEAPLIAPGDEVTAKLKYRAAQAGELLVALRSLEDPEASETTTTLPLKAGDTGARDLNFTASPRESGFYLGVAVRGGAVDLDDIELLRGGKPVVVARAEAPGEPAVKTDCAPSPDKALAGATSWRCASGEGDRVTLGMPASFFTIALRGPSGDRGALRALSLEGGRSVDATMKDDGELSLSLTGPGTLTVQSVEVSDLASP